MPLDQEATVGLEPTHEGFAGPDTGEVGASCGIVVRHDINPQRGERRVARQVSVPFGG